MNMQQATIIYLLSPFLGEILNSNVHEELIYRRRGSYSTCVLIHVVANRLDGGGLILWNMQSNDQSSSSESFWWDLHVEEEMTSGINAFIGVLGGMGAM